MAMCYPTPSPEGYWSVEQAAEFLGVHPESLRRAVRLGRINLTPEEFTGWRTRRKHFYKIKDVMAVSMDREALRK